MRLDQTVGAEAADEEGRSENPERAGAGDLAEHPEFAAAARRRRGRRDGAFAIGREAEVGGAVGHQQRDQRGRGDETGERRAKRRAPAPAALEPGGERQEDELARR